MRVIAGSARGLRLIAPEGDAVRPTSDRAREALMSTLGGHFDGERVLDLCAGTGAIGIELLSRGCAHATFVEPSEAGLAVLRENLRRAAVADRAEVVATTAQRAIDVFAQQGNVFDIVFIDPPWKLQLHGALVAQVQASGILAPRGEIVVERHAKKSLPPAAVEGWQTIWQRNYGRCSLERICRSDDA